MTSPKTLLKRSPKKLNFKYFVFEITPDCNQKCVYCYNVWKHNKNYPTGTLSPGKWQEIILKLKKRTKVKTIALSGGEPLLYPDILDLVKFIKAQKIKAILLTNGSLVDQQMAKSLTGLGISVFEIPLIAPSKTIHRRLKKVNDFNEVVRGIANLTRLGNKVISVFVATKENIDQIKPTLDLGIALGCRGLMFNRINPAGREQIRLLPSKDQLEKSLKLLDSFARKYRYQISISVPIPPCYLDLRQFTGLNYGYCPAGGPGSYPTIDSMGNLRVCNHSPTILGNVLANSFEKIFRHPYYQKFKKEMSAKCLSCKEVELCKGSCRAAAQVCYGGLDQMDPLILSQ